MYVFFRSLFNTIWMLYLGSSVMREHNRLMQDSTSAYRLKYKHNKYPT